VEAVALGHDLGHTPFGHLGEEVLNEILQGRDTLEGLLDGSSFGGFKHNYQSLRAVDALERRYTFPGLNLTAPVREGILKHTRLKRGQYHYPAFEVTALAFDVDVATTLEGQVVAIADEVAQRTHDLEDGLRAGLVKLEEVRELEIIRLVEARQSIAPPPLNSSSLPSFPSQDPDFPSRNTKGDRDYLYRNQLINGLINSLVSDVIRQTLHNVEKFVPTFLEKASMESRERLDFFDQELVRFSAELEPLQKSLNAFIYQRIIFVPTIRESDEQVREVLRTLFRLYYQEPGLIPAPTFRYELLTGKSGRNSELAERPRQIADFIAGMTDHFALAEIERLRRLGLPAPKTDDRLLRPARKLPAG
jgi:dGTPase